VNLNNLKDLVKLIAVFYIKNQCKLDLVNIINSGKTCASHRG